jgi:hypothetical protein
MNVYIGEIYHHLLILWTPVTVIKLSLPSSCLQIPVYYFKVGHDSFLPYLFGALSIKHVTIRRYMQTELQKEFPNKPETDKYIYIMLRNRTSLLVIFLLFITTLCLSRVSTVRHESFRSDEVLVNPEINRKYADSDFKFISCIFLSSP